MIHQTFISSSGLHAVIGLLASLIIILAVVILVLFLNYKEQKRLISTVQDKVKHLKKGEKPPIRLVKGDLFNKILFDIDAVGVQLSQQIKKYNYQKDNLNAIVESVHIGVMALDESGKIRIANKTAQQFFEFKVEHQDLRQVIRNLEVVDRAKKAFEQNEITNCDYILPNGDIIELRILPVQSGRLALLIIAQNVTELRKLGIEKQDFFENASHELSTPLTSILGYAEMLKKEESYKEEFVGRIITGANRMLALLGDMLSLSALEGSAKLAVENVDLEKIALEVITTHNPRIAEKNLKLVQKIEPVTIKANKEKIIELLSNLIDNAIKYTQEEGIITVRIKKDGTRAVLKVKDTGKGIAKENLSRIFERFFREETSRTSIGTGLGLSIVKHICNLYGAGYSVKSTLGQGSEFTVMF